MTGGHTGGRVAHRKKTSTLSPRDFGDSKFGYLTCFCICTRIFTCTPPLVALASLHPLAALLQHYVVTDDAAVTYLPSTISVLQPPAFQPSAHLAKWTARVNSLIASKNRGARWAGICLAARTAECSKEVMVDSAAGWVANVLPALQRQEPLPTQSVAVSLLDLIFSRATDMPEFARQVCIPNVPKFSLALISLCGGDKATLDLKILCLRTLSHMLSLYPNVHRSLQTQLHTLCLSHLHGTSPTPTPAALRQAASALFASACVTGGKVGAADIWKKNMLGALRVAADCVLVLRSTGKAASVPSLLEHVEGLPFPPFPEDPLDAIPIALDRLRCMSSVVDALFRFPASRPVSVPIGPLIQLCTMILQLSETEGTEPFDSTQRTAEQAALPEVWKLGSDMFSVTARITRIHMVPYASRLLALLLRQLERTQKQPHCLTFLRCLNALLSCEFMLTERQSKDLLKIVLPLLSFSLGSAAAGEKAETKKSSKKRGRPGYEGDEVFRRQEDTINVQEVTQVSQIVALVLKSPSVPMSFRALSIRHLANILLHLEELRISNHDRAAVWTAVWSALEVEWLENGGAGGSAVNLAVNSIRSEMALHASQGVTERLERLLHPRLPPLLKNMPTVELLGFRIAEGEEEKALATRLGLNLSADPAVDLRSPIRSSGKAPPGMAEPAPSVLPQQTLPTVSAEPAPEQPLFMQSEEMQPAATLLPTPHERLAASDGMDVDMVPTHSVAPPASYGSYPFVTAGSSNGAVGQSTDIAGPSTAVLTEPSSAFAPAESTSAHYEFEATLTTTAMGKGKDKETATTTTVNFTSRYADDDDDEPMPILNLEPDTEDEEDEDEEEE